MIPTPRLARLHSLYLTCTYSLFDPTLKPLQLILASLIATRDRREIRNRARFTFKELQERRGEAAESLGDVDVHSSGGRLLRSSAAVDSGPSDVMAHGGATLLELDDGTYLSGTDGVGRRADASLVRLDVGEHRLFVLAAAPLGATVSVERATSSAERQRASGGKSYPGLSHTAAAVSSDVARVERTRR